jgi:large subunit ribosomal protein L1
LSKQKILESIENLLENSPKRNFKESVDLAINLKNLDMSQPKNRVDVEIVLPNGLGKTLKIAVFAKGEVGLQAKGAGANYLFTEKDLKEIAGDKQRARSLANECDFFIAEVQFMGQIGKNLGSILGPRGKMPIPLTPDKNVVSVINGLTNTIRVRSKDRLTFHVSIGRRSFEPIKLAENANTVVQKIESVLEKGKYNLKSIHATTTMGKSVRLV